MGSFVTGRNIPYSSPGTYTNPFPTCGGTGMYTRLSTRGTEVVGKVKHREYSDILIGFSSVVVFEPLAKLSPVLPLYPVTY